MYTVLHQIIINKLYKTISRQKKKMKINKPLIQYIYISLFQIYITKSKLSLFFNISIITYVNHIFNNLDMFIHAQTLHSIKHCLTNKYIPENKTHIPILLNFLYCKYNLYIYRIAVQESNVTKQIILAPLTCAIQV